MRDIDQTDLVVREIRQKGWGFWVMVKSKKDGLNGRGVLEKSLGVSRAGGGR